MSLHAMLMLFAVVALPGHCADNSNALNPIRKVVTMLQKMQKKVQHEAEQEADLYKKFMCYCKTNGGDLTAAISTAEEKVPEVSSNIDESEAKLAGCKAALNQAQTDRAAAKQAMADATSLREKEAAEFASFKADHDANVLAIAKAVAALEKGMAGSFLQTPMAEVLRKAVAKADLPESDQEQVIAFLSSGSQYAPSSGEITGILKEMGDTMAKNLADATTEEKASIETYGGLMEAKKKEVGALTAKVESKTTHIGELGVSIVMLKEDLEDTQASLAGDKSFLAGLDEACATKTSEWEERSKTRAEELVALADTIKVLNDDDALELFKKTLPSASASLLELREGRSAVRARVMETVRAAKSRATAGSRPMLDFLALVLAGKHTQAKDGFASVVALIDRMVVTLKKEQGNDDDKKEYCSAQHDLMDDKRKALERTVAGEATAIATAKEGVAAFAQEIEALTAGIKDLDTAVASATEQRKAENSEYKSLMASNTAAKEVLAFAKNRLNKFYNSKLYKAAPKVELSSGDRIYGNLGGVLTTGAPGGIADTGITVLAQVSVHEQRKEVPAPPPATWDAYAKKGEQSTGVIAMMDLLIRDLEKEMTEADTQEKDSQKDYEEMMKDCASKRGTDSSALTRKGGAKADLEAELEGHMDAKADGEGALRATEKYIQSLHAECDWLVQYYDVRKAARASEVESLHSAKAVLSGSDYSLIQKDGFLRRSQ